MSPCSSTTCDVWVARGTARRAGQGPWGGAVGGAVGGAWGGVCGHAVKPNLTALSWSCIASYM